jgi:hypothetical protein
VLQTSGRCAPTDEHIHDLYNLIFEIAAAVTAQLQYEALQVLVQIISRVPSTDHFLYCVLQGVRELLRRYRVR